MAGGKGVRMESDLPKVLIPVAGKPLIDRILDAVLASDITTTPVVVVGYEAEKVRAHVGDRALCVLQAEQKGTAHAVQVTEDTLRQKAEHVIVLNGDHPLISPQMINDLHLAHTTDPDTVLTLATTIVPDFSDWRAIFSEYGRVVRNESDEIIKVVEAKDATGTELGNELNLNYFCFDASWLWQSLKKVQNHNAQHEYYLTSLIGMATSEGRKLASIQVENHEALGVNSKEQLKLVEDIIDTQ
jgi:bifunctional UDP-N-acetylglucosamine pyrophosphorylase/glucosamine-1-phosphate N-acetyltransferase